MGGDFGRLGGNIKKLIAFGQHIDCVSMLRETSGHDRQTTEGRKDMATSIFVVALIRIYILYRFSHVSFDLYKKKEE